MTAVVTGAAGFVGRALVGELLDRGERVVGVDRAAQPATVAGGGVELTADLLDRDELVDAAFGDAGAVYHLAGCPGVRGDGPAMAAARERDNVQATARVLAAVPLHVPLVVVSSSSVYGGSHGRPSHEGDPLAPRGGYARSKVQVERLCAHRARAGGLVAVARPFTVVGEGQRPDMALATWLRDGAAGRPLRILGSLERTRDVTDVRDVVRVLAELAARRVCGPVNIGTGVGHTLAELVAAVSEALGADVDTYLCPADPAEVPATLAGTERLREVAGFVPRTDLRAVVARQAAAVLAAVPT